MIEIDSNAREILRAWKKHFGKNGLKVDYSESIRIAEKTISKK